MPEQSHAAGLFSLLCRTGHELSAIGDLDELLEKIMQVAREICAADASSILMVDNETRELYFKVAQGEKGRKVKSVRFALNEGIAGWVAANRKPLMINDVLSDPRYLMRVDVETSFQTRNMVCVPIIWENELLGIIEVLNKRDGGDFTEDDLKFISILASQAAVAINSARTISDLQNFFIYMVEILVMAIESVTKTDSGFTMKVARTATKMARQMGISGKDYENLYYASMLFNIGKLMAGEVNGKVPSSYHSLMGGETLRQIMLLEKIAPIVEAHLERYDGSGGPRGLKGEEIPMGARILGMALAFEERRAAARNGDGPEVTPEKFVNENTSAFDPAVARAFLETNKAPV
jgi:HD-GYP domain-containing protein (c-di-GMP phosphodiesterase class II)